MKTLHPGDYFGEIGVIYDTIRTCTVTTKDYAAIATLEKKGYQECCTKFPNLRQKLEKLAAAYEDPWETFVNYSFARVPYFTGLSEMLTNELMYSLQLKRYEKGDTIFKSGQLCDRVMIISRGQVSIMFELSDNASS